MMKNTKIENESVPKETEIKRTKEPIFKKKTGIFNVKEIPITEMKEQPYLFLMKKEGYIDIIPNIKAGEFVIKDEANNTNKSIFLSPKKMQVLRYGDQMVRCWIAHEDCMGALPEDPVHDATLVKMIIQKIAANYQDMKNPTGKIPWGWIIGIGAALILGYGAYKTGMLDKLIHPTVVKAIAHNITQNVTQNVGVVVK